MRQALCASTLIIVTALLSALPSSASAYSPELRRYPYLTDVVGSSATVNWGTDRSAATAIVKYGAVGSEACTAHSVNATRTSITVNGVNQYQWKARLTLAPDSEYCYRVYLGTSPQVDLLGADSSPQFRTQLPRGSNAPFSFAVFGDWGYIGPSGQNPDQASLMSRIASSGARFALTTGDNAYPSGSQANYGDLVQTGPDVSGVFSPQQWTVAGASMALFPAMGNHGFSGAQSHLLNWPQDSAVAQSGGRYTRETHCCLNGTASAEYPSTWYAFDAGNARFYVLEAAWTNTNLGTASEYENDADYHWTPSSDEYKWLQNDLATNPRALKFAFLHYPLYSDNATEASDPFLHGPDSLEGLLGRYGVDMAFSGHSHIYQRNLPSSPTAPVTYVTGAGGAPLMPIGANGCTAQDAYGIGWSYSANGGLGGGSACGAAPTPTGVADIFHFLRVNVSDTGVTVTPTDELGREFDVVTYPHAATEADLSVSQSAAEPALAGQPLTYTLIVENHGPASANRAVLTDRLPAGVTYESAEASQGACSEAVGTVTCELGTLASGGSASVTLTVRPPSDGPVTNSASVVADDSRDSSSANNASPLTTTVQPATDLSLAMSDSADPSLAGEPLTYTVTARNDGPSPATGVTVADSLPAGVTYHSATPSQGSCAETGGSVSCDIGGVAAGASATVEIQVTPEAAGTIVNTASVDSNEADPDGSDNAREEATTIDPATDLSLEKADDRDPVRVGDALNYSLSIRNNGPSAASGVTLSDHLPAEVGYGSVSTSQGSCSEAAGTVNCDIGTLVSGGSATVGILVTALREGSITNSASVAGSEADTDSSNNDASASTVVDPVADLSLSKSDSPDPVLAGEPLTYTLTARNAGPSTAPGVALTDELPAGVSYELASPSQGSCSEAAGTVSCDLGSVASGGEATVEIRVRPGSEGTLANAATVSSSVFDPDEADNSASQETTVEPAADLSLTKSDSPDPILVGQSLTYTLTARNAGPSTATGVALADDLPATVSYDSATASQGSCSEASGTVTCDLGSLASGASATVAIHVTPEEAGTLTNTATLRAGETDLDSSDNTATEPTTVAAAADLSITKSDSPDPVLSGGTLTYTLTVHNHGPTSEDGVTVTDTLPASVVYQSATSSQGICLQFPVGSVSCDLGTLATGGTATIEIGVTVGSGGTITNTARVRGGDIDPDPTDNVATASTIVDPADLSLTKSDSVDPVFVGRPLTYTLTARNGGPVTATGVTVTDQLPAGTEYGSASASQGACSEAGGTVTCDLGDVPNGGTASVEITVVPRSEGTITNVASVQGREVDPDSSNNAASESTVVDPVADLSLTKSDSPDPVSAGEPLTYTLTASNAGPSTATAVSMTDDLPAGVSYESATTSQGSCSEAAGRVSCDLGSLASGASATVAITIRALAAGTIENGASIRGSEFDPDESNNAAIEQTTVDPAADLSITKSDSSDPVLVAEDLTYTLTARNAGPQNATGITVTDALPAGIEYGSATPSQGSCAEASGTVTCDLGTLADGATATVEIVVRALEPGTITNVATIRGDLIDPRSGNDSATESTVVDPVADLSISKSDSPDPVLAGQVLTYTLTARNDGPTGDPAVTVRDELPAGVNFDSASPSQGSCGEAGGVVTCQLGGLASGEGATVAIRVRPQVSGTITNSASVQGGAVDPDGANNAASQNTTVAPAADLSIDKTDAPDPALSGHVVVYTLAVRNNGPSATTGVTVNDALPAGVAFESATSSQGVCLQFPIGTVSCDLGTLADGATATVEIRVTPQSRGTISNTASVEGNRIDPIGANNTSTATTVIDPADLALTISDDPDPAPLGQELTYTLTVHNNGIARATGVSLTDELPAGVSFGSVNASQGNCSEAGGTVSCNLGDLASGASATVHIRVVSGQVGALTNRASVTGDQADPDSANNSDSEETTVEPAADLSIAKSDSADPVLLGHELIYVLTVRNGGPLTATGVTVTDELPANLEYRSASSSQGTCSEAGGTVSCAVGDLADGASATVEIVVTATRDGTVTNTARVHASEADPDPADDSATESTVIDPVADLSLTKSDSSDPALAGETLTYTLTAANAGPSTATGVAVTDDLPANVAFDAASASQGSCVEASGTVACRLGSLASGESATVTIDTRPQEPGTIANSATVASDAFDPDATNNDAGEMTAIEPAADLSITKSDSADPIFMGQTLSYQLGVRNAGPVSATGVVLTDHLPADVAFESASASQGSCGEAGGTVTCNLGTLASGATADVEIRVIARSHGAVTNTASVRGDVTDPRTGNDADSEETTVLASDHPLSAMRLGASLVPAFRETISSTQCAARGGTSSSHGSPLAFGSCNPPGYIAGTAARLGPTAVGSASITVLPGNLSTPADEADALIAMHATDVRSRQTGSDYDPSASGSDVRMIAKFRVTDAYNGPGSADPATVVDFDFPAPVQCLPTADPALGSACDLNTSANALVPGSIKEGKGMVVQLFRVRVNDSGSNGILGDADDRMFAQQGLYAP